MKKIAVWILVVLFCFCGVRCSKNKETHLVEYISYEYGKPWQESPEGFDILFVAKVDQKGNAEIITRTTDTYKTFTGQISKKLLNDIKSLDLKSPGIGKYVLDAKRMRTIKYGEGKFRISGNF